MWCCSPRRPASGPLHLRAAIEANKHVFCEKPIATDAPGVRHVLETVKMAKEKNLNLVAGFCWRYANHIVATFDQIHSGAMGDMVGLLRHLLHESREADAAREHAARRA